MKHLSIIWTEKKINLLNKWQFVENITEIMRYVLKMQ